MLPESSWAVVGLDDDGQPATVLMLLDDKEEADAIAFELRRTGTRAVAVRYEPEARDPEGQ